MGKVMHTGGPIVPDRPFHSFGVSKSFAGHNIRRSPDLEAITLKKGLSGTYQFPA